MKRIKLTESFDHLKSMKNDNFVIELDKYWPFGLDSSDEPENSNLLFFHSQELASRISCRFCTATEGFIELGARMRYSSGKQTREVSFEDHEVAYQDFLDGYQVKTQNQISTTQLLRPKCCSRDGAAVAIISEKDLKFTRIFRYFYQNNRILVYLKLDPASTALIPYELDEKFASTLKSSYLNAFWAYPKGVELMDTSNKEEADVDEGFGMKLRDYQLRSLTWMKAIESNEHVVDNTIINNVSAWSSEPLNLKIKLGFTGFYIGFKAGEPISANSKTEKIEPLKIYGGILADEAGSGKSITTLGLIYSNPFTEEKQVARVERFKDLNKYKQSRASLIICPENIQLQWLEKARKCFFNFKIVNCVKDEDYANFKLQDVCDADIVFTSYQFIGKLGRSNLFENVHFHRIILDELHELTPTRGNVNSALKKMKSDHIWGLTGTPNFSCLDNVLRYFGGTISSKLDSVISSNIPAHNEFMRKFVKRNDPDLGLPPIEFETIWVHLSSSERFLMNLKMEKASRRAKLMMCSHYQLSGKSEKAAFLTLEQVKARIINSKKGQVQAHEREIHDLMLIFDMKTDKLISIQNYAKNALFPQNLVLESAQNRSMENTLNRSMENTRVNLLQLENELKMVKIQIESISKSLQESQRKLNYCQNVFKVIDEPTGNKCNICFELIEEDCLSILPCSHLFCYECIISAISANSSNLECPLCRQELPKGKADIFKIIPESSGTSASANRLDTSRYSSKMVALTNYLMDLMETQEDAKIILFLQYKDLGDFISDTMNQELKLNHVRVSGDVTQRQFAIKQFCEEKDVKLIMLSSEDSVSGIDLVQATHVILLHPFYTDQGEDVDLAYEKQGISRAYRFGLEHSLKVVRFVVKGTIEEDIMTKRSVLYQ